MDAESTLKPDGTPKINLNQQNLQTLQQQLSAVLDPSWANFIVAYRQGVATLDGGGNLVLSASSQARNTISSPLDLVGVRVPVASSNAEGGSSGGGAAASLSNPFTSDSAAMGQYLPQLFANCTTVSGTAIPGRININQAPRLVLLCIPGMTSDMADQIISNRVPDPSAPTAPRRPGLSGVAADRGDHAAGDNESDASLHYDRGKRLSGPNSRSFRQGKSCRPAGSHA